VIELGRNRYGKAQIHVVRVLREPDGDRVRDVTVAVALEGDFDAAHTDGDNRLVVTTDTMKNTAFAFARDHLDGSIDEYGRALAEHFLEFEQVDRATVNVRGCDWRPIDGAGQPARDAFVRGGEGTRIATVAATRAETTVEAGVEDLIVMKTTRSAFKGFPRDRYTTLPETDDRLMATKITAIWRYGSPQLDFDETFGAVRATLLETFADHESPSVQTSIWIMARAILERHEAVEEVRMVLPNLHHWLADLSPFGMTNENQVYVSTTEPHGLIEATVRRSDTA
jgi:urate oxidase